MKKTRASNYDLVDSGSIKIPPPQLQEPKDKEKPLMNIILAYLENMKFPTREPAKDRSRSNVITEEVGKDIKNIIIEAFAIGQVRSYSEKNLVDSKNNRKFPELLIILDKLVKIHNPKFEYTTIQINKSLETAYHRDKGNIGLSYCLGLGNFKGGGLVIKHKDKEILYDNKDKWLYYDGASLEHKSAKVNSGTRYAIIYFTHK